MLKALRLQVSDALNAVPVRRRPALRRSDAPGALLATDLPLVAGEEAVVLFTERMQSLGWDVSAAGNGWLLLDAPVPAPEAAAGVSEGECGCCISLLSRHPEDGDARDMIRAVVKAADAGRQPFERLCGQLHGQLAAMLRLHRPLPSSLLPYLYCACNELYDRRNAK